MEYQNRDFKYFMQDTGSLYLGAKYSYQEILEDEMVTFKFKSIVEHYIMKDTAPETTLESQLYYMTPEQFSYKTYRQLKARVKVSLLVEKRRLAGNKLPLRVQGYCRHEQQDPRSCKYENRVMKLDELVGMNLAQKKKYGVVVQELILSKLSLMAFSV